MKREERKKKKKELTETVFIDMHANSTCHLPSIIQLLSKGHAKNKNKIILKNKQKTNKQTKYPIFSHKILIIFWGEGEWILSKTI